MMGLEENLFQHRVTIDGYGVLIYIYHEHLKKFFYEVAYETSLFMESKV